MSVKPTKNTGTASLITDLYNHMQWADATLWQAVLAETKFENDERLRNLLHHIHLTQTAFLAIWNKQNLEFPKVSDFETLYEIAKWGHVYHQNVDRYLGKVTDSDLEKAVDVPWAKRYIEETFGKPPEATTLSETIVQVAMHSAHHRGQVTARLRELGAEPPLIDFIAWLWLGRPEADWPK